MSQEKWRVIYIMTLFMWGIWGAIAFVNVIYRTLAGLDITPDTVLVLVASLSTVLGCLIPDEDTRLVISVVWFGIALSGLVYFIVAVGTESAFEHVLNGLIFLFVGLFTGLAVFPTQDS